MSGRPLSPHLQIYRWPMNMAMSILHRMTGAALSVGVLFFIWWLVAAALGPEAYAVFAWFCGTPLGLLMLFGWTLCMFYHLGNGIRHLVWDSGFLFEKKNANIGGWLVLLFTAVATGAVWMCVLSKGEIVL